MKEIIAVKKKGDYFNSHDTRWKAFSRVKQCFELIYVPLA